MAALRKLLPLGDRVLVRRVIAATKTPGGLLLPESKIAKSNEGEVLAVGPGRLHRDGKYIALSVVAGDKVLLPEYGGTSVKNGDKPEDELFLFREDEILAKLGN